MVGSGYTVSRTNGDDRFYNPPPVRRQQQLSLQQQQRSAPPVVLVENRTGSRSSGGLMALPKPPMVAANVTNLDRFMSSVTPLIQSQFNSEGLQSDYCLGDLWDSFGEWSVYGVGVPLVLNGTESVVQYYVPFLSGIQLYVDPAKHLPRSGDEAEAGLSRGMLAYEYMEKERPYNRQPLANKISVLASEFPELRSYKGSDLLPSSWISVAWYPIYRIPMGPTLKDLDASFLTFHTLSTNFKGNGFPWSHGAAARRLVGDVGVVPKVSLPVFGLASYKFRGSLLSLSGPIERHQEGSLLQAADHWIRNLRAHHPDYEFFWSHYSQYGR